MEPADRHGPAENLQPTSLPDRNKSMLSKVVILLLGIHIYYL